MKNYLSHLAKMIDGSKGILPSQMNIKTDKSEINKILWLQCYSLFPGFAYCFLQSLTSQIPTPALWFPVYFYSLSAYGLSFSCYSWISNVGIHLPFLPVLLVLLMARELLLPLSFAAHVLLGHFLCHICIFSVILGHTSTGQSHWLPHCLPVHTS